MILPVCSPAQFNLRVGKPVRLARRDISSQVGGWKGAVMLRVTNTILRAGLLTQSLMKKRHQAVNSNCSLWDWQYGPLCYGARLVEQVVW